MIQPTTALRKISALTKRIRGVQGGQGAGKSFAILILLINHALQNPNKEIFIASDELSKMRITIIKDFLNIMKAFKRYSESQWSDGVLYKFTNGSFIRFIGLDKVDIGKGLRCDVMFVNEANKVKFDTYRELTSRAKMVFIDFNPNKKFWFHNEVINRDDCDFLKLTYLDNEYLGKEELAEILRYKERGFAPDGRILSTYWANMWRVYGLGEIGQVEGRIYTWQSIPLSDYLKIPKQEYTGCDWGKVDPWAILDAKYSDGNLYLNERHYKSENEIERNLPPEQMAAIKSSDTGEHEGLIGWVFNQLKIPKDREIVCDTNRPSKILSLRRSGWEYAIGVGGKTKVVERAGLLAGLNIFYTDTSKNLEYEQENYCYDKDKEGRILEEPIDQDNHLLDATIYTVQHLFKKGIIRNV